MDKMAPSMSWKLGRMKRAAGVIAVVAVAAVGAGKERGVSDASADGSGDGDVFVGLPLQMKTMGVEGLRLRARAKASTLDLSDLPNESRTLYEAVNLVLDHGRDKMELVKQKTLPIYVTDFEKWFTYGFNQMTDEWNMKYKKQWAEYARESAQRRRYQMTEAADWAVDALPPTPSLNLQEAANLILKNQLSFLSDDDEAKLTEIEKKISPAFKGKFKDYLSRMKAMEEAQMKYNR